MNSPPHPLLRPALTSLATLWSIETLLSLALQVMVTVGAAAGMSDLTRTLAATALANLFTPIALGIALAALCLAHGSSRFGTIASASLAAFAFVLLGGAVVVQQLSPQILTRAVAGGTTSTQQLLALLLMGLRLLGWTSLVALIHRRIAERDEPSGTLGETFSRPTVIALTASTAVITANLMGAGAARPWAVAGAAINLAANLVFIVQTFRLARHVPTSGADIAGLLWTGRFFALRGTLVFMAMMLGLETGARGLTFIASAVLPVVAAVTLVPLSISQGLAVRSLRPRGLATAAASLTVLAAVLHSANAAMVWMALLEKHAPRVPFLGASGFAAESLGYVVWLLALSRAAGPLRSGLGWAASVGAWLVLPLGLLLFWLSDGLGASLGPVAIAGLGALAFWVALQHAAAGALSGASARFAPAAASAQPRARVD